jgi:hypothetical protein
MDRKLTFRGRKLALGIKNSGKSMEKGQRVRLESREWRVEKAEGGRVESGLWDQLSTLQFPISAMQAKGGRVESRKWRVD